METNGSKVDIVIKSTYEIIEEYAINGSPLIEWQTKKWILIDSLIDTKEDDIDDYFEEPIRSEN